MALIPRRLVYRALAQVLHGQARTVAGRTAGRSVNRRGLAHQANAAAKEEDRHDQADDLRIQAGELTRRVGDPRHYQGPGLDPSLLGWLCAWRSATPRPGARSSGSPGRASWRGSIGSTCRWCLIG